MATCRRRPVWPLYMTSHPRLWYPHLCSAVEMFSTVTLVKGVASPSLPTSDATCASKRLRIESGRAEEGPMLVSLQSEERAHRAAAMARRHRHRQGG